MELLEVEEVNRWPFRLRGFSTEGQGSVVSWGRGRLSSEPTTDGCSVRIYFQPPYDGTADFSLVRRVRSLREVSSGHPAMQVLNPQVVSLSLVYQWRR